MRNESKNSASKFVYPDLLAAQKLAYEPSGLGEISKLAIEAESKEYGACVFEMNLRRIKFRVGKITPTKIGQFVFPKTVLHEKGILSKDGKRGKRAMRVYPPWDRTDNQQAKNTQKWQILYFFEINPNTSIDTSLVQKLFLKERPKLGSTH